MYTDNEITTFLTTEWQPFQLENIKQFTIFKFDNSQSKKTTPFSKGSLEIMPSSKKIRKNTTSSNNEVGAQSLSFNETSVCSAGWHEWNVTCIPVGHRMGGTSHGWNIAWVEHRIGGTSHGYRTSHWWNIALVEHRIGGTSHGWNIALVEHRMGIEHRIGGSSHWCNIALVDHRMGRKTRHKTSVDNENFCF